MSLLRSTGSRSNERAWDAGFPVVEARGLVKRYHTGSVAVEALRGVDVSVAAGEIVAIMGPSGCGKTTLLHCLSGLDDFDEGQVHLAGTPLRGMSDDRKAEFRARYTGFIFQAYNLLPVLDAAENVELPLLLAGVRGKEARARALAALDAVGLNDRARHRPSELSGGQQQRVAIARALVNEPAVVWADEPTGNLDSHAAEDILNLLQQLNAQKGQTLVLVTHAAQVSERAHRILWMRDGQIEREERPGAGSSPSQNGAATRLGHPHPARRPA
ncbi:MAG: ABC transporter ATP-binding protein [Chloroflexi bacterium]|nr:ABC transporter ATP-binding protein [Chloroflexota bacterium]